MDNTIYRITGVTDHDGKQKSERVGRLVRIAMQPILDRPIYLEYVDNKGGIACVTSDLVDYQYSGIGDTRTRKIITRNSIYYLEEVKDGETQGE